MPVPHPRCRLGGGNQLDRRHVQDWAPPGWHWEVLPSGDRNLVRNRGLVVDPELLWWRSRGPQSGQREPASEDVLRRRVKEEDQHVRRYLVALDAGFSTACVYVQSKYDAQIILLFMITFVLFIIVY